MSKYKIIGNLIRERIRRGEYAPGSCLPGYRELAEELGVSYVTVSNAVRELQAEGLVDPVRGQGIYIRAPRRRHDPEIAGNIGLIGPIKGDLFQNFFDSLLENLDSQPDLRLVPLTSGGIMDHWSELERRERFSHYLNGGYRSLIINGNRHFDFRSLHCHREHFNQLTFVIHFESELDFPGANIIEPDYVQAGRLAAEYLLDRGAEIVVMMSFELQDEIKRRMNGSRVSTYDHRILDGVVEMMRGRGASLENCIVMHDEPPEAIAALMRRGRCGFIGIGDHRLKCVYRTGGEIGFQAGRDFNAVGLFNTSWGEIFTPALTSVSVNEKKIGELAIRYVTEKRHGKKTVIAPELIIRKS